MKTSAVVIAALFGAADASGVVMTTYLDKFPNG